jgi:hypothetical protein
MRGTAYAGAISMPSFVPLMPTKSTAAVSVWLRNAWTGMLRDLAQSSDDKSTQAAPSVSGELLPAVSVPAGLESKAFLSMASFSREVSPRTLLSRCRSPNGMTRSSKKRACHAAAAFL